MPNWKKIIVSGSDAVLNSLNVATTIVASSFTGSLFGTASYALSSPTSLTASYVNPLRQTVQITGSLITTGSNTLIGNTSLTGSFSISGSEEVTGYIKFLPVNTNIDTTISASYIYVSGSTNDLYFSQNGNGYNNVTRLRWIEGNLYTGLLSGGVLSSTPGSTTFNLSAGSGIIVTLNASTASVDPYPTVQYVKWNSYTSQPITYSGSAKITYVGIDNAGAIVQQVTPFGTSNINQWDQQIELGTVLHLSGSVSSGVYNAPQVSYGVAQRTDDFVRAFGPIKVSGHTLQASGSTLSLIKTSGVAYNNGANYVKDPNHPSTVSDPAVTVSKIYRYYISGSTPVIDAGVANAGYTVIDPSKYVNTTTGNLATVTGGQYSIQRVFWIPNSPTNAFIVYYGNAKYNSLLDAQVAINTEPFTEAPNTAQNGILLGYIIVDGNATNLQNEVIIPAGLFRGVNGVGNSGTTPVSATLDNLSDVSITGVSAGDLLYYGGGQWQNGKQITGNYGITGSLSVTAGITANLTGTASYATTALTASNANTASYVVTAQTASYVVTAQTASYATQALTASYAATSSYANNFTVGGTLTVQTIVAQTVTSSIDFVTGSTRFGSSTSNTHQFTGSVSMSGSLTVTGSTNIVGASGTTLLSTNADTLIFTGSLYSTGSIILTGSLSVSGSITGSLLGTASYATTALSSSFATLAQTANTASYVVTAQTASYILNSISASYATSALTASYALTVPYSGLQGTVPTWNQNTTGTAATASYVLNAVSASNATTASSADNFTVRGTLTAQTIVVQTITSSVVEVTGSTQFGSTTANTHEFTGSVTVSGSLQVNGTTATLGTGTINTVPKFTAANVIGNSNISDSGALITLNTGSYINGALGIGTTSLTGNSLKVSKNITGATFSFGIYQNGIVQSDVTDGYGFYNDINTAATSFTLSGYRHYIAAQNSIGAGSTVTTQYGFVASSTLIGATTNYGFYGGIPSGSNNWNLYMTGNAKNHLAGNLSIGSVTDNGLKLQVTGQGYFSDSVGIGTATLAGFNLNVAKNLTGAVNSSGIKSIGTVQSDVTGIVRNFDSVMSLQATAFTLSEYRHYATFDNSLSGGAVVTTQTGFYASSNFASATNNYGFRGQIASGSGRYNLYMDGTADNYLNGALGMGTTVLTGYNMRLSRNLTGSATTIGVMVDPTIQSDSTTYSQIFRSSPSTAAATFTLPNLYHFYTQQGTFGAGSTVTNQSGYYVDSTLIGATNNYGFRGTIPSGTNRFNIYMDGTADNYLRGNLGIGSGKTVPSVALDISGSALITGSLNVTAGITGSLSGSATTSVTASYAITASYIANAQTASYVLNAQTASYVNILNQNVVITGSLFQTGSTAAFMGNVGIGTTTPGATLDVNGIAYFRSATGIYSDKLTTYSGTDVNIQYGTSGNLIIGGGSAGAERMRITNSGSVGIGLTTPAARLHVSGTIGGIFEVDGDAAVNALYVSASGNVGVGTTTPTSKLQVEGGTLRIGDGAGNHTGFSFTGATLLQSNNNPITFQGALRVNSTAGNTNYISGSGGLAIGKTTSNSYLDVNGNAIITGSLNVTAGITGSLSGSALTATSASYALTASYAANVPLTSSYALVANSASYALTASYVLGSPTGSSYAAFTQASPSTTWTFNHNLGYLYPVVTVYDANSNQIIPSQVSASTTNQLQIIFSSARTGYATAVIGSATPTPSTINVYTAVGANALVSTVTGSYNSAFFNYSAVSASNARAGQIMTIWTGSAISFSETTTNDIGNTSGVTFTASLSGNTIAVTAGTTSANWNIKLTSAYL